MRIVKFIYVCHRVEGFYKEELEPREQNYGAYAFSSIFKDFLMFLPPFVLALKREMIVEVGLLCRYKGYCYVLPCCTNSLTIHSQVSQDAPNKLSTTLSTSPDFAQT